MLNVTLEKKPEENLGFLVWNSINSSSDMNTKRLPNAPEVKLVYTDSVADKIGIKVGDRILKVWLQIFFCLFRQII